MMLQICPEGWLIWLVIGLLCATVVHVAHQAYFSDLREIPGPLLAKFSTLYRILMVRQGHAPMEYRRLHSQYGHIVRTGPKHVSVSDPDMIPVIYGIGSKFKKVVKTSSLPLSVVLITHPDPILYDHGPNL